MSLQFIQKFQHGWFSSEAEGDLSTSGDSSHMENA